MGCVIHPRAFTLVPLNARRTQEHKTDFLNHIKMKTLEEMKLDEGAAIGCVLSDPLMSRVALPAVCGWQSAGCRGEAGVLLPCSCYT